MIEPKIKCHDMIKRINSWIIFFNMYHFVLICYWFKYDIFKHFETTFIWLDLYLKYVTLWKTKCFCFTNVTMSLSCNKICSKSLLFKCWTFENKFDKSLIWFTWLIISFKLKHIIDSGKNRVAIPLNYQIVW